jgi:glycosyltransferase involved in cell wall biosynthesis
VTRAHFRDSLRIVQGAPVSAKPVIVLLGNYATDRQESMLRFRDLMQKSLSADGYTVESIAPQPHVGSLAKSGATKNWLGIADKYAIFPLGLLGQSSHIREKYLGRKIVVHICDHSNAVYATLMRRWFPVVVTCHDLLAVRGALGEDTDCHSSPLGKLLQKEVLHGLKRAHYVVCDSQATRADLLRLGGKEMAPHSEVIPLALNYPYAPLSRDEALAVLKRADIELDYHGYILHVGSSHKRKNREALLLSVAKIKETWTGKIVFAGEPLTEDERAQVAALGLSERVKEIVSPDGTTLHALYAAAHALVFMSRAEGFGWPIIEAQAAECPVICSDRTSVPEIAGEGALVRAPDACGEIAADIERLQEEAFRERVVTQGRQNAAKYTVERMMRGYEDVYRRV